MHDSADPLRRAWMVRTLAAMSGGTMAAWLAGCANLLGPRTVSLSADHLLGIIGQRFPLRTRLLQTLDVTLAMPRLRLLPQSNRLATDFQLIAGERLSQQSWQGALGLSHGVRYEPSDSSIRLTGLRVERLEVPGAPNLMESQLARLALSLVEPLLQDLAVHRFKPEDLRVLEGLRYVPAGIQVTHSGVAITLQPQQRF